MSATYRVTRGGVAVGMVRFAGTEVFARRFDGLTPREAARVRVWADGFLPASGLFSRAYHHDGTAEWGLELVPYTEWVGAPKARAHRPGRGPRAEGPEDMRHNPDLDAVFGI